jgi:agmatinase
MRGRPVFVSVDMDVLDPSTLPGTGTPEPGGPTYRELREALVDLAGSNVVGLDLVEVAPPIDASGLSAVVAAELAREAILALLAP